MSDIEQWDLWYPHAGSGGLAFARARLDAGFDRVIVHGAPPVLDVTIRDGNGAVVARGSRLERKARGPMIKLVREGDTVRLEDMWPEESDLGTIVLLPGGEAGKLTAWWNREDKREWRWSVEFYNHH